MSDTHTESTRHVVASLAELRRTPARDEIVPWHARLIERDIGGGRQSLVSLDVLAETPEATALTVSGLDQPTFERLVARFGQQFTAINFWKCPRIADLAPLESLPQVTHVALFWNQRATRLWDFSRTPRLAGLHFDDFTRLSSLDELPAARSLRELGFGNAIWNKFEIPSLGPVGELAELRSLAFNAKRICDGRIQPLARLSGLDELHFPSNLFTTEQIAWLRVHLPSRVTGCSIDATRVLGQPLRAGGKTLDTLVNGKGKPFLDSRADAGKLGRYIRAFEGDMARFRADPDAEPAPLAMRARRSPPSVKPANGV